MRKPMLLMLVFWGFTIQSPQAVAVPFSFSNNFDQYGRTLNFTCPEATGGVCGAIAAINSFVFLQNRYPGIYDNLLVPNGDEDPMQEGVQAQTDAENFAADGWQVPGKPPRIGYYTRTGDANEYYLQTKMDWIGDFAPGTTIFSSIFGAAGFPTIEYLANEIRKGEDVEFFIKNVAIPDDPTTPEDESVEEGESIYHALTLVGIACNADCGITFQDPNDPATPYMDMIDLVGGRLEFDSDLYGTVFIDAAYSESPIPEPGILILLGSGIAMLRGMAWRKGQAPTANPRCV